MITIVHNEFSFTEVGVPCPYWSSGQHIVTAFPGKCRCGKKFKIVEDNEEPASANETKA